MSVNTGAYMRQFHEQARNQGHKVKASDFTMVIDGFEDLYLLTKQCPWPITRSGEPIEVPSLAGTKTKEPGQSIFLQQGPAAFFETETHRIDRALAKIICGGGEFNSWIYHGNPKHYIQRKRIHYASFVSDTPETDLESAEQLLLISGTLHFMYYGQMENGNVKTLLGGAGQGGQC